jgi:hypothetical protein
MLSIASIGDIPNIVGALTRLESAFLSNSTIVPTIQSALYTLKDVMVQENFVSLTNTCHSQRFIHEEASLNNSWRWLYPNPVVSLSGSKPSSKPDTHV